MTSSCNENQYVSGLGRRHTAGFMNIFLYFWLTSESWTNVIQTLYYIWYIQMFDRIHLCFPQNSCQIDKSINCIALPLLHITRNNCWPSSCFKTETNALTGVNRGLSSSECVSFCTSLNVPSYCSGHYKSDSLGKLIADTDIQAFTQPLNNPWPQYKCQYRSLLHPWVPHLIINRSLWTRNLNVSQPQFNVVEDVNIQLRGETLRWNDA